MMMNFGFEGFNKKIVISGGTEGIGKAIASEFLAQGQEVAICARTKSKLDDLRNENEKILAYEVDLADKHTAKQFMKTAINDLGGLNLLVLNAAIHGVPDKNETQEESRQRKNKIFKINEVAQVALTRAASDQLRENKGTVVFITSGLARKSMPGAEDYSKSKKELKSF